MTDIQFNTDNDFTPRTRPQRQKKIDLISTLVNWGIAKDARQASYILFGIAVIAFTATLFLLFSGQTPPEIPPEDLLYD